MIDSKYMLICNGQLVAIRPPANQDLAIPQYNKAKAVATADMQATHLENGQSISSGNPADAVATARTDNKRHLLLAASGSVATIKIFPIIQALSTHSNLSIRLVLTEPAAQFLGGQSAEQPSLEEIAKLPNVDGIYRDEAEWRQPWKRGAAILHIELRKWADVLVVAPLSANTMAKMVAGMSDNLLLSVVRAWDVEGLVDGRPGRKIVVAPAMNTAMMRHPVTTKQLKVLEEEWGGEAGWVRVLRPMSKALACGDVGDGAMISWEEIVKNIERELKLTGAAVAGH
ncbi:putative Flavoprotein [Paramyrothecium foliicola]|nr:putative Flavoprotein [Paramyrothecium foliicola]